MCDEHKNCMCYARYYMNEARRKQNIENECKKNKETKDERIIRDKRSDSSACDTILHRNDA